MKSVISASALGLLVFAACFLQPSRSQAATDWGTPQVSCYKWSDGSGICWGSYAAFRTDPDTNTYASASSGAYTWGTASYFSAMYHGLFASCYVPNAREPLVSQLARLTQHRGEFTVSFDNQGYCTQISLSHGSGYDW